MTRCSNTTTGMNHFNNIRLSAAKIRLSQSKFSLYQNKSARNKSGRTCCSHTFHFKVTFHIISVWPVNTLFQTVSKCGIFPKPWKPITSFLLSNKFKHFLCFLLISGTFRNEQKTSRTALTKENDCVMAIFRQTCQKGDNFRVMDRVLIRPFDITAVSQYLYM